jgi:predicted small metal-binding protein
MKSFACKDIGMECDWKIQGKDNDEILRDVRKHADEKHGLKQLSDDLVKKVKARIKDQRTAA